MNIAMLCISSDQLCANPENKPGDTCKPILDTDHIPETGSPLVMPENNRLEVIYIIKKSTSSES